MSLFKRWFGHFGASAATPVVAAQSDASVDAGARPPSDPEIAAQIARLGAKTVGGLPNGNYFNERFRDYEWALMNVKTLGYYLGKTLADRLPPPTGLKATVTPLTSRLCTQGDIESDWLAFWCSELRWGRWYHRKIWELCFITQAIFNAGKMAPGAAGIGFGCGEEPLPSLFARYGASVLATDQAPDEAARQGWAATNQHAATVEKLRRADICPDPEKLARIELRYVDMNDIPADLTGKYDFCWSACALEHLGSIANGLAFIENSLKTLRPGGVAVHTFEYTLADDVETIDNWPTVLFQKKHVVDLAEKLAREGYLVNDLDFSPGAGVLDQFVDVPPWRSDVLRMLDQWAQLKLSVDGFVCTSFGIIVRVPE